jgi:signal transduction histidine kinase
MSATASAARNGVSATLFVAFLVLQLGLMVVYPHLATVPYHLIFIGLTIVYGYTLWSLRASLVVLLIVTISTGAVLLMLATDDDVDWQECTEILLMPAIFLGMLWHSHRQLAMRRIVETQVVERQSSLDHERQFMQDASHALRTPITIARGHIDLVVPQITDPDVLDDLAIVTEQLERMAHLSATLVALEEIESAQADGRDTVDIGALVHELHRRWSRSVERTWSVDVRGETTAEADGHRVEMALEALIENAVKHTDPGGRIRLSADGHDDVVDISVADDGEGIPVDERERVFLRFAKGRDARPGVGSGLGLALVRAVATSHGGTAWAGRSALGGAELHVQLPRAVGTSSAQPDDDDAERRAPWLTSHPG